MGSVKSQSYFSEIRLQNLQTVPAGHFPLAIWTIFQKITSFDEHILQCLWGISQKIHKKYGKNTFFLFNNKVE